MLTVEPLQITSICVAPNPILAGTSGLSRITLNTNIQAGMTLTFTSSNPAALTVPQTVTVKPGIYHYNFVTFGVGAEFVESRSTSTVTASIGSSQKSTVVTVNP